MRLLLLNTCGGEGSAALADLALAEPVAAQVKMPGRTASERLVAVVRELLSAAEWQLTDLAAIAVVTGPGSFTGVRVGLSVAKGLSEASGVPIIAVSRLEMLGATAGLGERRVCALLDAGRGEYYCGQYDGGLESGEALLSREAATEAASKADVVMVCEEPVLKAMEGSIALRMVDDPSASDALPLALRRLGEGDFDDPMTLDANYLRRTDAEIFAKPACAAAGST